MKQTAREVNDEERGSRPVRLKDAEQPFEVSPRRLSLIGANGEMGFAAASQERLKLRLDPVEDRRIEVPGRQSKVLGQWELPEKPGEQGVLMPPAARVDIPNKHTLIV